MGKKTGLKRVVIDTNVLVSSLIFEGFSNRLVDLWKMGSIELLASAEMVREYTRVLAYPKFKLSGAEAIELLRDEVLPFVVPVKASKVPPVIREDPSDDQFLACALEGKADAIVSGDKHLFNLKNYHGIPILNLRTFLERLTSE